MESLIREIIFLFVEMAPYLMFGFLIAGVMHELLPKEKVLKHLGAGSRWPEIKAALLGVPLPLCSCSVIPTALSLKKLGAKDSAVVAFLTSTPQTGADCFFVSYMILGPVMAVFSLVSTFLMGFTGGFLVKWLGTEHAPSGQKSCCQNQNGDVFEVVSWGRKIKNIFHYGFVTVISDIGAWLLLGIVLAGVMSWLLPEDFFSKHLGSGPLAMLIMVVVSIPLYICATASIPIAAALMMKGLSAGAAFVFLTAGSATNLASVLALSKTIGRKNTGLYLLNIIIMSIACGLLLDALHPLFPVVLPGTSSEHEHCLSSAQILLSVLFALLLAFNLLPAFTWKKTRE